MTVRAGHRCSRQVNQAFAQKFLAVCDPVGQLTGYDPHGEHLNRIKHSNLRDPIPPLLYQPEGTYAMLVVGTACPPLALLRAARRTMRVNPMVALREE